MFSMATNVLLLVDGLTPHWPHTLTARVGALSARATSAERIADFMATLKESYVGYATS